MVAYQFGFTKSNKEQGRPRFNLKSAVKIWRAKTLWWVFHGNKQHTIKLPFEQIFNPLAISYEYKHSFIFNKFLPNSIKNYTNYTVNKNFLDINFKNFFNQKISIVGPSYKADPEIVPYLSGFYKKNDISNFRWNYFTYRQTFLFINRSQFWNYRFCINPSIMHIGSREDVIKQNRIVANFLNHQHVSIKWIGGMLTNTRLKDIRKFISNVRIHNLTGKEPYWVSKPHFRQKMDLPSMLLVWDTHHNDYAVNDGIKLKIPIVGVVDNLVNPRRIIYPLVGQNFNEKIIAHYQKFIIRIFFFSELMHNNKNNSFVFFFKQNEQENQIVNFWSKFHKSVFSFFFLKKNEKKIINKINKNNITINKLEKTNFFLKKNLFFFQHSYIDFFESFFNFSGVRSHFKLYSTFLKWKKIYKKMLERRVKIFQKFFFRKFKFKAKKFRKKNKKFLKNFKKTYFFHFRAITHKKASTISSNFKKVRLASIQNYYKFRFIKKMVRSSLWKLTDIDGNFLIQKPHMLQVRLKYIKKFSKFFNIFKIKQKRNKKMFEKYYKKYYKLKGKIIKKFKRKYLFRKYRIFLNYKFKHRTRKAKILKFVKRQIRRYLRIHKFAILEKKILEKKIIKILKPKTIQFKIFKKIKILKKIQRKRIQGIQKNTFKKIKRIQKNTFKKIKILKKERNFYKIKYFIKSAFSKKTKIIKKYKIYYIKYKKIQALFNYYNKYTIYYTMLKIKLKKKHTIRFRVVKNTKVDPWGISVFLRRRLFLRSLHTYFKKIKDMRRKRNFTNVLLLDKSRGKIKKRIGRKTMYGRMLMNKQRLQKFYNVHRDNQLRQTFRNFRGFKNKPTTSKVLSTLELRLDNVLRRCYFVPTIQWARQSIIHGRIKLNNKIIKKPAIKLGIGQEFQFPKKLFYIYNMSTFFKKLKKYLKPLPNFIMIDYICFRFFIIDYPKIEDIFYPFNGNFINLIQFYQNRRT